MNPPELVRLMGLARRRVLTEREQTQLNTLLAAHPEAWPERQDEQALARLLRRLPGAPLATLISASRLIHRFCPNIVTISETRDQLGSHA